MTDSSHVLDRMVIVVTGATGPAGLATTSALAAAGATVVAVGHSPQRLAALAERLPSAVVEAVDLSDPNAVNSLAARIRDRFHRIDGLIHLVGGYRGGDSFTANTEADWAFLSSSLIDTLRHTTLALHDDLVRGPAGRVAIVSARAAATPAAGSANYAAAKAAAEAWMLALADSFRQVTPEGSSAGPAAVIFVVKALVTEQMRADGPHRRFPGFTDVADLADRIVELWSADPAGLNGAKIRLDEV